MKKRQPTNNFGPFIDERIRTAKVKKYQVVEETGIHASLLSRIIGANHGVSKPTVISLARAVNKLAGEHVIDENEALQQAGYETEENPEIKINLGCGITVAIENGKYSAEQIAEIVDDLKLSLEISLRRF